MKLSKIAISELSQNRDLRLRAALALGIGEQGVIQAIKRNSKVLANIAVVDLLITETGLTKEQLLESNQPANIH